jgi:histidine triad (HIT) family protein
MTEITTCTFCDIVAHLLPSTQLFEDEDVLVINNILGWTPVMLLVLPKEHMNQQQLWSTPIIAKIGRVAVEMGELHCPDGYRIISNVGYNAMQSQKHGHIHVLGGTHLGQYA